MGSNLFAAIVLILVGLFLLASKQGMLNGNLGALIAEWWPALLVAVGIAMLFKRNR